MDLNKTLERVRKHHEALQKANDAAWTKLDPQFHGDVTAAVKRVLVAEEAVRQNADQTKADDLLDALVKTDAELAERLANKALKLGRQSAELARERLKATTAEQVEALERQLEETEKLGAGLNRQTVAIDELLQGVEACRPRPQPAPAPKQVPVPLPWPGDANPPPAPPYPKNEPIRKTAREEAQRAETIKSGAFTVWDQAKKRGPDELHEFSRAAHVATVAMADAQVAIADSQDDQARSQDDMAKSQRVMAHSLADLADPERGVGSEGRPLRIQLKRADLPETEDTPLWASIRNASLQLGWASYTTFLEGILGCDPANPPGDPDQADRVANRPLRLPFPDADPYRFLKAATEVFMMVNCETWHGRFGGEDLEYARRRGVSVGRSEADLLQRWTAYTSAGHTPMLPYLALIREKLGDQPMVANWPAHLPGFPDALAACTGLVRRKLTNPCFLELIWSYWHEEGMLVQAMNAITRRFQNIRSAGDRDPLQGVEIDPLRPLNNFLWGYIQDEQHRLTVMRRAYEYDHHYGLKLVGRAVPGVKGADSRTKFVEAFHNLLHVCTIFFKEDDDTTVIADGFPVLNALRDVHVVLSQGAHNQYGDLPWTARQEMLMQQWILGRPEFREFLPTRIMVAYPEPWMDRVDAMKGLMGWTDASVLHFRELAVYGERILLGARFNNWTDVLEPERAANWARYWRPEIQGYVHAYRAVAGVDLTERAEATMPSTLLRNRLATQRVVAR